MKGELACDGPVMGQDGMLALCTDPFESVAVVAASQLHLCTCAAHPWASAYNRDTGRVPSVICW